MYVREGVKKPQILQGGGFWLNKKYICKVVCIRNVIICIFMEPTALSFACLI